VSDDTIFLMRPDVGDAELELVKEVLDSKYLVEGPMVREFERLSMEYTGAKHAMACTSATTGLELALRALGVGHGDEVIVPDFTHPATALVVETVGATPVLVDVELESRNTTAELMAPAVTEKTRAAIPVSIFGHPLDMDPINELAAEKGFKVIEDAACTLGAKYKGRGVGSLTDITVFSFHPRKVFTTGDGGLITTNDDELAELIRSYKHFGAAKVDGKNRFVNWGTNSRMSNVHGAVVLGQVRRIEQIVNTRRSKAAVYDKLLEGAAGLATPKIAEWGHSNYQTYAVLLEKKGIRDQVIKAMKDRKIQTQIGTYALHVEPHFEDLRRVGDLANSTRLWEDLLALPLHYQLTDQDQQRVVRELVEVLTSF